MKTLPIASFALAAAVAAVVPAQGLTLDVRGGGLGQPLSIEVGGGGANQAFILGTSLQRAAIPLALLDGKDTRFLGIAVDLPFALVYGQLDNTGGIKFTGAMPNNPAHAGVTFLQQALTHPGTNGYAVDGLSEVAVLPIDTPGVFKAQTSTMSAPRQFATNIPLKDGRVLIVGGAGGVILWQNALDTSEVFDPATKSFSPGPKLVQARSSHTQTRLRDGRYLIVGGVDDKNVCTASCEVYDPAAGQFSAVGSLTYKRVFHQAILMNDGRVVVIGGFADLGATLGTQRALESGIRQVEIFDPATNQWTVGASAASGRGAPGAEDLGNGKILVIGGVVRGTFAPDLSLTCELYDTATNQFSPARSIPTRTAFMTTFQLPGNRVLLAGGDAGPRDSIRNYRNKATTACLIYTASTNSWSTFAPLPVATSGGDAITLRDGTQLMAGGGDNTLYWPHGNPSIYELDVPNNRWITIGTLVTGRNSGETIELQAGGLAVIGGGTGNAARSVDTWEMMVR